MCLHQQKIGQRSNPQSDGVGCASHILAGDLEFDGIVERLTASFYLEDTKVCEQFWSVLLHFDLFWRKKLHLHLNGLFSILEVNLDDQLKILFAGPVAFCVQQQL